MRHHASHESLRFVRVGLMATLVFSFVLAACGDSQTRRAYYRIHMRDVRGVGYPSNPNDDLRAYGPELGPFFEGQCGYLSVGESNANGAKAPEWEGVAIPQPSWPTASSSRAEPHWVS